jgi:hypothetical protein
MSQHAAITAGLILLASPALVGPARPSASGLQAPVRPSADKPRTPRLYIFDCGTLDVADTGRFRLKREEVTTDKLSVGCYLVAHPGGTLIWDTGAVPDGMVKPGGAPVRYRIALPDAQERFVTLTKSLKTQLADAGYRPADITYVVLSHYPDHPLHQRLRVRTGWCDRWERDATFAAKPPIWCRRQHILGSARQQDHHHRADDYDVETARLYRPPPAIPRHQVPRSNWRTLAASSGPAICITTRRSAGSAAFPLDDNRGRPRNASLDAFLKTNNAQLWFQDCYGQRN